MSHSPNYMREKSKARRADNRVKSTRLLVRCGVDFESKNGGAHLIVKHDDKVIDFWPGTGKWVHRGSTLYQRGVFKLINELGIKQSNDP